MIFLFFYEFWKQIAPIRNDPVISGVHLFLWCIVGLNECTREHPLWFQTPIKKAVPSNSALFEGVGGDFG